MADPSKDDEPEVTASQTAKVKTAKYSSVQRILANLAFFCLAVLLVIVIVLPTVGRTHHDYRAICAGNINAIGRAIRTYCNDGSPMPPDFQPLVAKELIARHWLRCPLVFTPIRECDYFFLPAASDADPETIIACDYRNNHRDGTRNVLYASLLVRFCETEKDFQADLAKPCNAAFAKALQAAEGP